MVTYALLAPGEAEYSSQSFMLSGTNIILAWNSIFFILNGIQIIRLVRERKPVEIPHDIRDIYENVFTNMSSREFLYFWSTGEHSSSTDEYLVRLNEVPTELFLLTNGKVSISKNGAEICQGGRGSFIAEMSMISGNPASADVKAVGEVSFMAWDHDKLNNIKALNPKLSMKIQEILSRDVVDKLRTWSCRNLPVPAETRMQGSSLLLGGEEEL
jgi:hypothetical protein